jgi:tRNA-splicing ligase RtcB
MGLIRKVIPLGFSKHNDPQPWFGFFDAPDIPVIQRELANARLSLGTLGGGNHFIEFQRDPEGGVWCTIHSGSRNFGLRVASEYHVAAQKFCERNGYQLTNDQLAYLPLDSVLGHEYKTAMNYAVVFASANRAQMMQWVKNIVAQETGAIAQFELDVRHNYASEEWVGNDSLWVHRKGAVFAGANVMVIIPGSMGSPTYIGRGLGNADALNSCSHGAGRRMGRGQAKRALDLGIEQERMRGIVHGLRSVGDLDEAPSAYKDIDEVMAAQTDLVTPTIKLAPLANIKG